ncbi:MAG TPA: hypothetical protein VGY53_01485, partial [Isosphaeraceae bacterium]|nr:hypothetical protein [Isosphaeraceae bacterium]
LGTWIALRSSSSRAAQSSTTIASLGFLLFHGVLLIAAASSFSDVSSILHWEPRVFWALGPLMLVVPLATGVYAWKRTCRMFERFDELVGRPHRTPAAEIARTKAVAAELHLAPAPAGPVPG